SSRTRRTRSIRIRIRRIRRGGYPMNALPLTRRLLADSWRGLIGWTVAIIAVLALYLPLYPSIAGSGQLEDLLASMPPSLVNSLGFASIASGTGYAQATYFGLLGFALPAIA